MRALTATVKACGLLRAMSESSSEQAAALSAVQWQSATAGTFSRCAAVAASSRPNPPAATSGAAAADRAGGAKWSRTTAAGAATALAVASDSWVLFVLFVAGSLDPRPQNMLSALLFRSLVCCAVVGRLCSGSFSFTCLLCCCWAVVGFAALGFCAPRGGRHHRRRRRIAIAIDGGRGNLVREI